MFLTEESLNSASERSERRHESRIPAHGAVTLKINAAEKRDEFNAVVINSSHGGLCIRHWRRGLTAGDALLLCSPSHDEIPVRVAWNWTVGPVVMSGLQLMNADSGAAEALDYLDKQTALRRMRAPVAITGVVLLFLFVAWYLGRL
jgi:hypothetical protein